ncbi:MAG: hypothetical protein L6R40_006162 [Gallowayella cf. fulva]|nr:MAG: hypothetical protein L6R40_006162 [Xanthomendoza cf. fulva]
MAGTSATTPTDVGNPVLPKNSGASPAGPAAILPSSVASVAQSSSTQANLNPGEVVPPQSTQANPNTASATTSPGNTSVPPKVTPSPGNNTSNSNSTSFPAGGTYRHNSNSIGSGAAAGIGIGCAIAGALIAGILAALLFRRRKRRAPARSDRIPLNGFASVDKSVASPDLSSPVGMIERSLPQPAEDQALGGEMSRLRTAIKNHVQSYYHTNTVRGSVDQVALGMIATGNMPLIASTLASLLSNPVTRLMAIRFCITWTVVSRIDQNCEPSLSFLPPEVSSCLISISSTRDEPATKTGFMSRWRSFTAALLQDRYGSSTWTASDARTPNISEALQALNAVLRPFADEQRDERDRLQKLEEILKRGARLGFTLFSQPSLWDFDWNTPSGAGRGVVVISPALVQVTDDNGRRLPRPRMLEEQELARGLETYL